VTTPGPFKGTVLVLSHDRSTIGRDDNCELRLDHPEVSRTHAVMDRSGGDTVVLDLRSTNGTTVNGTPVVGSSAPLQNGDVVSFGGLQARYEVPGLRGDPTQPVPASARRSRAEYHIDRQDANALNNVAGDQYNAYVQQEQRESFLRDIAATKSKARRLIWIGFGIFIVGFATYGLTVLRFITSVGQSINDSPHAQPTFQLLGPQVAGIPIGIIGFAMAFIGTVLMAVGLVLHIVAAARRRRLDAPALAPWQRQPEGR
jgi:hypothetical protein